MLPINQEQSLRTQGEEREHVIDVEEQALYKSHGWGGI